MFSYTAQNQTGTGKWSMFSDCLDAGEFIPAGSTRRHEMSVQRMAIRQPDGRTTMEWVPTYVVPSVVYVQR